VTNGAAVNFTVSVTTSGAASAATASEGATSSVGRLLAEKEKWTRTVALCGMLAMLALCMVGMVATSRTRGARDHASRNIYADGDANGYAGGLGEDAATDAGIFDADCEVRRRVARESKRSAFLPLSVSGQTERGCCRSDVCEIYESCGQGAQQCCAPAGVT
jgi:hypothetical protein